MKSLNFRTNLSLAAILLTSFWSPSLILADLADTDYRHWPNTPEWVQHTNTIQQLYNAYNERNCAVTKIKYMPAPISPTFIYPYQDYVRLATCIDNLVAPNFYGYLDSTLADSNGSFVAYRNANPTNSLYFTPATLHAAAGFTNWATGTSVRTWMSMDHAIQTQVWATLQLLKYTVPGTAISWTSYGATNRHTANYSGSTITGVVANLASMWMQPPSTNSPNQTWNIYTTPSAGACLSISGLPGLYQGTAVRTWGYYQASVFWTNILHTADFYFSPIPNGVATFDQQRTTIVTNWNMVPGLPMSNTCAQC